MATSRGAAQHTPLERARSSTPHLPPVGVSVPPRSSSDPSRQKMATGVNHQQGPLEGPSHNYPSPGEAHTSHGAYYDHSSQRAFEDDEDMHMANTLSQGMQHNIGAQLANAAAMSNGHGHDQEMAISPSGVGAPGMAPPPQTPTQPPLGGPSAQQGGIENIQDQGVATDSTRRKRSKVSRACDECRRKKIRCDATADDGSVKTCSNCNRIGQSCSFSRVPMKRGPSKGYIKELSERVQQVESQMAMSGPTGPTGYRSSLDAASPSGGYPDVFSPDESIPLSLKRTISLSEGKNPFAQPQFMNRDRMPSTGGWSINSGGQGNRAQGPRGSIAIAPDQQLPDMGMTTNGQYFDLSKPFWAQDADNAERPAKRQKPNYQDAVADSLTPPFKLETESLTPYFKSIHPMLPILPNSPDDISAQLKVCPVQQRNAFLYVYGTACDRKLPTQGSFHSYGELEDYVWSEARQNPVVRSTHENIVWLWIYLFMLVNADNDLSRLRGSRNNDLGKDRLIKMSVDLGRFAIKNFKQEIPPDEEGLTTSIVDVARQAWNCIGILTRLHAISTATEDDIPLHNFDSIGSSHDCARLLTDTASFLARSSGILSIINTTLQDNLMSYTGTMFSTKTRKLTLQQLDYIISLTPDTSPNTTLVEHFRLFVTILLNRHTAIQHQSDILEPTVELADSLLSETTASTETPIFDPLNIHVFALVTITLLEFTDLMDDELSQSAWDALGTVHRALEQIAERAHADTQERFAGAGPGIPALHWADGLLRMIDAKPRIANASDAGIEPQVNNEAAPNGSLPEATNETNATPLSAHQSELQQISKVEPAPDPADKVYSAKIGRVQMIDFAMLTRYGYLNVVADRNGV